jgi:hypothetical protein
MRWCSMRALEIKKKTLGEDHSSHDSCTEIARKAG